MSSIAEIQDAIARLSSPDFDRLAHWIEDQLNSKWDQQIEADSASGALDFFLKEVDEDIAKGRMRPTDEL
jgi:hypothetical protein